MLRSIPLTLLILISNLFFSCNSQQRQAINFNLDFKYGITLRNELDTFNNNYTKDMVTTPSLTVDLVLTDQEKQQIYDKMIEIDFFNYPDKFAVQVPSGQNVGIVTPYSKYSFHVLYDSKTKDLSWDDEITNSDPKADKLRNLIQMIQNIIESKNEYKQLPPATGAYQ